MPCNTLKDFLSCIGRLTVEVLVASLDGPLVVLGCVGCEVVLDTEAHVEPEAQNEDVARGVEVDELHLGYPNGGNDAEHDTEEAAHHCLRQRRKEATKFACGCRGSSACKALRFGHCKGAQVKKGMSGANVRHWLRWLLTHTPEDGRAWHTDTRQIIDQVRRQQLCRVVEQQ